MTKSELIQLRIDPILKERIRAAAAEDGRTISNYLERMIRRELGEAPERAKASKTE